MATRTAESAERAELVATTRTIAGSLDPIASFRGDDFAWFREGIGFVAAGAVAAGPPAAVSTLLAQIAVDDDVRSCGTGAIACGALPFSNPENGALVIPAHVVGIAADGGGWETRITDRSGSDGAGTFSVPISGNVATAYAERNAAPKENGVVDPAWIAKVNGALTHIARDDVRKVVIAREVFYHAREPLDRRLVLARLIASQHNCFVYAAPPRLVGASPELLVSRHGTEVVSKPLAGSVCAQDGAFDQRQLELVRVSAKEAFEHRVVVDAVVGTLSRHRIDVRFSEEPSLERFRDIAHLATTVSGLVAQEGPTALDLALWLHPTPSVCGTPTAAAREIIRRLEQFDRGPFAGPVGWVNQQGDGEWAIALRGAEIHGTSARLWAGAGIVAGSDAEGEWLETEGKLAAMRHALAWSETRAGHGSTGDVHWMIDR